MSMPAPAHTYSMGIIGNCAYAALIEKNSNIAWMCLPRFDSDFVFASLLDPHKGGAFAILPPDSQETTYEQQYIPNTNILQTTAHTPEGSYRITDFAPIFPLYERYYKPLMLFRKIERLRGMPRLRVICRPVARHGQQPLKRSIGSNHIRFIDSGDMIRLTTDIPLTFLMEESDFVLTHTQYLALSYGPPLEASLQKTADAFLEKTTEYWQHWVENIYVPPLYQEWFIRSALALKLHQFIDTGAIVASITTSLPEAPNSGRNWDYRYCWMRDAYYTLHVFNSLSTFDELKKYFEYLLNIKPQQGRYAPLYNISGKSIPDEHVLPLEGYLQNTPVRVGNQASIHAQNDVYGQILVSLLPLYTDKRLQTPPLLMVEQALEMIEKTMEEPDAGPWEFRQRTGMHGYTYLFHWAGAQAAEKIARILKHSRMRKKATTLSKLAAQKIEACYHPKKKGYAQAIGSDDMDASALQLITMNYLNPHSLRAKQHLRALEKDLKAQHGLFYRYKHHDDFGKPETTFLICAFWHVEALACVGRINDALRNFKKLLRYGNHLMLFSEDVDEKDGSQWGNFPQAYSHAGLINALARISLKMDMPDFLAR